MTSFYMKIYININSHSCFTDDLFAYFSETSLWHISFVSFPSHVSPPGILQQQQPIQVNASMLEEKLLQSLPGTKMTRSTTTTTSTTEEEEEEKT